LVVALLLIASGCLRDYQSRAAESFEAFLQLRMAARAAIPGTDFLANLLDRSNLTARHDLDHLRFGDA
jgi:hypothetical protein